MAALYGKLQKFKDVSKTAAKDSARYADSMESNR